MWSKSGKVRRLIHQVAEEARKLDTRVHVEFGVDVFEVGFDRVDADAKFACDIRVALTLHNQARDLGFAGCKRIPQPGAVRRCGRMINNMDRKRFGRRAWTTPPAPHGKQNEQNEHADQRDKI